MKRRNLKISNQKEAAGKRKVRPYTTEKNGKKVEGTKKELKQRNLESTNNSD